MVKAIKALVIAVAILVTGLTVSLANYLDRATEAYEKGDYATALREILPLAERGNDIAQHRLAKMYEAGEGGTQDYVEAAKWYRKSAEQEYADAQYKLGKM